MEQGIARRKTTLNFDRALAIYHETIKHQLTASDKGRFIAIDPETGEWEIDDTRAATKRLRARLPGAHTVTIRHVYIATEFWGSAPKELYESATKDLFE